MPKKNYVTIQITMTPELKADVDDLAAATRQTVSDMLRPIIQQLVNCNMTTISDYRNKPLPTLILPQFDNTTPAKKSKKSTSKTAKKDAPKPALEQKDAVTENGGVDNAEN